MNPSDAPRDPLRASPFSGLAPATSFHPTLVGYSSVWQAFRAPGGHAHFSLQTSDPARQRRAIFMALASLATDRLLRRASDPANRPG